MLNQMPYTWLQKERFQKEDEEALQCPKCNNTFFVQLSVNRYRGNESKAVGQGFTKLNDIDFPVYLCIRPGCHHIIVPSGDGSTTGRRWQLHEMLCDLLEMPKTELEPTGLKPLGDEHEGEIE